MFTLDRQTNRLARLAVEQQRALCAGHSHRATRLGRLVIRAARLYARAVSSAAAALDGPGRATLADRVAADCRAVDRAASWLGRQA
jgi:hypothetical protein